MKISDIVRLIVRMSGADKSEKEMFEELADKIDKIEEDESIENLDDISLDDIDDLDIDLDNFNIGFFKELDPSDNRPGKRSVDDFRTDTPSKPDQRVEDNIDVELDEDETPYHGETWVGVEDGYETFVDVPDDMVGELNIELRDQAVRISEPIGEKLQTEQLPDDISDVSAEITKRGRLLITVR